MIVPIILIFQIVLDEQITNRGTVSTNRDLNSHLYCPHDLSSIAEFRDDLPTLLGKDFNGNGNANEQRLPKYVKSSPALNIFATPDDSEVRKFETNEYRRCVTLVVSIQVV